MTDTARIKELPRMSDDELDKFCWGWNRWCFTRRFYIAPGTKTLLGRMQPGKVNEAPDAILSDDFAFFHTAVHALAEMEGTDPECFIAYYALVQQNNMPIKTIAAKLGISTRTFYERKAKFARRAVMLAQSLKKTHRSQEINCHNNLD